MKPSNRVLESMRLGVASASILVAMGCQQPDASRDLTPVLTNVPSTAAATPSIVAAVPSTALTAPGINAAPPPAAPVAPPIGTPTEPTTTATTTTTTTTADATPTPGQLELRKRAERAEHARALQLAAQLSRNNMRYAACGMG